MEPVCGIKDASAFGAHSSWMPNTYVCVCVCLAVAICNNNSGKKRVCLRCEDCDYDEDGDEDDDAVKPISNRTLSYIAWRAVAMAHMFLRLPAGLG